jgi:hypothetical protein
MTPTKRQVSCRPMDWDKRVVVKEGWEWNEDINLIIYLVVLTIDQLIFIHLIEEALKFWLKYFEWASPTIIKKYDGWTRLDTSCCVARSIQFVPFTTTVFIMRFI